MSDVWVLTKMTYAYGSDESDTRVLGVYRDRAGLEDRVQQIAARSKGYALTPVGAVSWRIDPDEDEDEGFFGNRPIYLTAHQVPFHE